MQKMEYLWFCIPNWFDIFKDTDYFDCQHELL